LSKPTKFIAINELSGDKAIQFMAQNISRVARVSPVFLSKNGEAALKDYEKIEKRDITNIFHLPLQQRSDEVKKIIEIFKNRIRYSIGSEKRLEKSLPYAVSAFRDMFFV
jgi:hypothetical protein